MKLALLSVNLTVFLEKYLIRTPRPVFLALVSFCLLFNGVAASAQSSGKPRATKVTVAKVTTDTISEFSELQGRLVAGAIEAVTAATTAKIQILDRKNFVGPKIADSATNCHPKWCATTRADKNEVVAEEAAAQPSSNRDSTCARSFRSFQTCD